jgi:hypothetical protein
MIIAPVHLGSRLIPNEDSFVATVIKLLQSRVRDLDMCKATKHAEVVHGRCLAMPHFIGHLSIDNACWRSIEDVNDDGHCLPQKIAGKLLRLQHASVHPNDALVVQLHHPVLLRRVWGGELLLYIMLCTVSTKLHQRELPPPICTHDLQFLPCPNLDRRLEIFDHRRCLVLAREYLNPHEMTQVID